jgi:hypothetical protein
LLEGASGSSRASRIIEGLGFSNILNIALMFPHRASGATTVDAQVNVPDTITSCDAATHTPLERREVSAGTRVRTFPSPLWRRQARPSRGKSSPTAPDPDRSRP